MENLRVQIVAIRVQDCGWLAMSSLACMQVGNCRECLRTVGLQCPVQGDALKHREMPQGSTACPSLVKRCRI